MKYYLRTLGSLLLQGPDQRVIASGGKHLLLLCFVARQNGRKVGREELAALLWGDKDETHARQSLRQALLRLRRDAGDAVEIDGETVSVRPDVLEDDLNAFDTDVAAGHLADAVALYRGDFLDGQEDAGNETFRAWIDIERARLRRRLTSAFESLVDEAEARGDLSQALDAATRWIRFAALDERAHQRCIVILQRQGKVTEALALFDEFSRRLALQVEANPSVEFLQLRGELQQTSPRRTSGGRSSAALHTPILAGRHAELATIRSIWSRIADDGAIVLIEGEDGAGRSRFIREVADTIRRSRGTAVVLELGATKNAGGEPFAAARHLLAGLADAPGLSGAPEEALAELSALIPVLRQRFPHLPPPTATETAIAEATGRVLSDIAFEARVLLAVDDVLHVDEATLRLLVAVMRTPPPGTLFVLTARPDELARAKALGSLIETRSLHRLKLQPLGSRDVAAILESMLDFREDGDSLADTINAQTGGNPYYVTTLIHGLADVGALSVGPTGEWRVTTDLSESTSLPPLVRAAVGDRLDDLGPDARHLVDVASTLTPRIDPAHLQAVAHLPQEVFSAALAELLLRRILSPARTANELYHFTSPIVGRAVYELLPPARRRTLHADALAVLERDDGPEAWGARDYHRARAMKPAQRSRRRAFALGAAAIAVLGPATAVLASRDASLPAASDQRLVVLEFRNETGRSDLDPLGRIAADWLTQGISRTALIKVMPQLGSVASALGRGGPGDGAAAADAASNAGADVVVWGSYHRTGDSIAFHARVSDAHTGRLLGTVMPIVTSVVQPMAAIEELQRKTLATIAPWIDQRLEGAGGIQSQPPSYEAYRVLAEGLDYLYRRDGARALPLFMGAYALDTLWTLPLLYAAYVHVGSMRLHMADSLVKVLMPRRGDLAPYDRYVLDGMVARLRGDAPAAFAAARNLAEIAPRSMWAAVELPTSALALNLTREALQILTAIDTTRGAARDLPGFWNLFSTVLHVNGLYERQLELGKAIRQRLPEEFRALFWQARALAALGSLKELDAVLEEGLRLAVDPVWGPHGMRMHVVISDELTAHGHAEKAREVLERALRFYGAASADISSIRKHRFDVALALQRLGRLDEARRIFENLLAGPPIVGANELVLRSHLGLVSAAQGDLKTVDEVDRWLRNPGRSYLFGANTVYRAQIQAVLGNREEAVRLLQQAVAEGRVYEGTEHHIFEYQGLRGYAPFEEWLRSKG